MSQTVWAGIESVGICVGTEAKCVLVMNGRAGVYFHGSYDEIRAFADEIRAAADRAEAQEAKTGSCPECGKCDMILKTGRGPDTGCGYFDEDFGECSECGYREVIR